MPASLVFLRLSWCRTTGLLCKSFQHVVCCFSGYSGPSSCHPHFIVNFSKMQEQFLKNENLCVDRTCNPHPILPRFKPHCSSIPILWNVNSDPQIAGFFHLAPCHFGHISGVASHSPGHLGSTSPTVFPVWRANHSDIKSLEAVIRACFLCLPAAQSQWRVLHLVHH